MQFWIHNTTNFSFTTTNHTLLLWASRRALSTARRIRRKCLREMASEHGIISEHMRMHCSSRCTTDRRRWLSVRSCDSRLSLMDSICPFTRRITIKGSTGQPSSKSSRNSTYALLWFSGMLLGGNKIRRVGNLKKKTREPIPNLLTYKQSNATDRDPRLTALLWRTSVTWHSSGAQRNKQAPVLDGVACDA